MKLTRCIAPALVACLVAAPALGADRRDTVARKFGEAFALAQKCPAMRPDIDRMTRSTLALGIAFDDAFELLVTVWKNRTLTDLYATGEADACNLARMLYGAKGTSGPGLLVEG